MDEATQKSKNNIHIHINTQLNEFYNKAQKVKDNLLTEQKDISIKDIRDVLSEKRKARYTLLEWYRKYIDRIKRDPNIQSSSLEKYKQTLTYLIHY